MGRQYSIKLISAVHCIAYRDFRKTLPMLDYGNISPSSSKLTNAVKYARIAREFGAHARDKNRDHESVARMMGKV